MKVVVVGCTHTGVAAVTQILQEHPGTEVTVYERHDNVSFLSCGIPLYLNGEVKRLEDMFYSNPKELESLGANVKIKHDVIKIDAEKKEVVVEDLETTEVFTDTYDKLIMATGSSVVVPPLFGIDNSRVLLCKDYDQAREIYETAKHYHHVAIVGGGYVGVELAESYANTDHQVTLIQGNQQLLNNYVDEELSNRVVKLLEDHQVEVHLNKRVQAFSVDNEEQIIIETNENDYKADLVIVATGFVANTELLRGQVDMTKIGAIKINEYMQSSDPNIYAGGDAAVVRYNPTGRDLYIPLATNAIRQGLLAGRNIFRDVQKNLGTQATSALQIFGNTIASSGITLRNALHAGINADSVLFEDDYRPNYMPSTEKIIIILVYDRDTRRVLGAQLLSKHEVAQSANTVSVLIQNNNTIDDMAYIDMLFQPHFDFPYNYLNLVAQLAVAKELKLKSKK
ncbi:FAD-dependent oxidoreductase [Pediococcus claussenii]|uniref:NADH oxidase n=1 Tax=Pediococcus claussenii (strain ATCC BAA-344 / DSM 14800 / JCM 18046 / KCTC 3811 / LMG 21948 / P06) TaxID=701521 RepID=G8PE98_PEDCP|nr:FAD-dependent oxidoreductase [Pediococcus claussenii]AEV94359.1 NADH oxidase [Pediococcus claussenii ATCC BAA-344]ANZ69581.1 NADH oxidase [Pediococcus claussenii]ANZ71398.1 NADH oxidase [Pediococcus claussenii]KRN19379.1 nox protein [Pediococcus claussenii]